MDRDNPIQTSVASKVLSGFPLHTLLSACDHGNHTMDSSRFISNPALDNPAALHSIPDAHSHLLASLTKIITRAPPVSPWSQQDRGNPHYKGLFGGPTSIAYTLYCIHLLLPYLHINGQSLLSWAKPYLECGQEDIPLHWPRTRELSLGIGNEYLAYRSVRASINAAVGSPETVIVSDIRAVHDALESALPSFDFKENEWIFGRAGTLVLLRILQFSGNSFFTPEDSRTHEDLKRSLTTSILANSNPWIWHEKRYLGAVHGDIGILAQLLLSDPSLIANPDVQAKLVHLLSLQLPTGGFPTKEGGGKVHDLLEFCHGAPGLIYSLLAIWRVLPETGYEDLKSNIDEAIAKARKWVWERGILRKQPCLCHGVTGNALVLETKREREHFMWWATEDVWGDLVQKGEMDAGDDPWGLWWGEAGRSWGWACLVAGVGAENGLPGFSAE